MLPLLPLTLALAFAPSLVSAGLYPKDSLVKMIDARGFRSAMKENRTNLVAFVASWCGHCKAMVPEYSKAALGLHPLIPLFAVDCDENRSLCADQGVKGFPTVKLFPRGKEQAPILFEHPERTASAFFYFATRRVPHKNKKLYTLQEIEPWVNEKVDHTRVLLLSKVKDIPLMWKVLANKYRDDFAFANHRDRDGKTSVALGYDAGTKKDSKILVYQAGSTEPFLFEGVLNRDSISKFFDSILDGTTILTPAGSHVSEEAHELTPEEEEIERKQEAQRLAILHGGYTDMIDFEKAVKKYGKDFHGGHGYDASLSDTLKEDKTADSGKGSEDKHEREEDPIHKVIRLQQEEQKARDALKDSMPRTGDANQVVLETPTADTAHSATKATTSHAPPSTETPVSQPAASSESMTDPAPTPEGTTPPETGHAKDEL
ncbi:hypothetical protein B0F90DRAFT_1745521 [Multifurca ochricompacta]|uniref:Thioredoxin domain-containing protein n=1 Tax=Multifurca ochricompacta TaxID=376703 RepID=A0AAD4LZN8_9AGAM|nr:hypothetical protein B0F90DRAFT_1745521 [Multifurca ochricompacta]